MKKFTFILIAMFLVTSAFSQSFMSSVPPSGKKGELVTPDRDSKVVVTHNNSQVVVDLLGLTCQSSGITTDNQFFGVFDLANDFGITGNWDISSIEFGVDAVIGAPGDAYPIDINCYTTDSGDPNGTLTFLGGETFTISAGDALMVVAKTFATPITVPDGGVLVVELECFTDGVTAFRLGATDVASNDDSWLLSEPCGLTTAATYASIGFGDRWHIMNVVGDAGVATAPVTFIVDNTANTSYTGFALKGSWDAGGNYDVAWGGGVEHSMFYDDGTNGDVTAGDDIWTCMQNLVPDAGANTWEWGVNDQDGEWIDGNWQFTVADETAQELTYSTVGVNSISAENISIYPNPSNGTFNVNVESNYGLEILDITGKIINTQVLTGNSTVEINTAGVYFLRFSNEEGSVTQRVIVQ